MKEFVRELKLGIGVALGLVLGVTVFLATESFFWAVVGVVPGAALGMKWANLPFGGVETGSSSGDSADTNWGDGDSGGGDGGGD